MKFRIRKLPINALDEDSPDVWLRVVLHPNVKDMRRAARKTTAYNSLSDDDLSQAMALFQPHPLSATSDSKDGPWVDTTGTYAGIIRLAKPYITMDNFAHEATHAACHILRMGIYRKKPGEYAKLEVTDMSGHEEPLCYLVGNIVASWSQVQKALKEWHD